MFEQWTFLSLAERCVGVVGCSRYLHVAYGSCKNVQGGFGSLLMSVFSHTQTHTHNIVPLIVTLNKKTFISISC